MLSRLIPLCLLLFACFTYSLGQGLKPECPSIDIFGPAGIPQPDDKISYTVRIGKSVDVSDLKYHWTLSTGEIVAGQGTASVAIKWPQQTGLTVTIEVTGLPKNCPSTVSATAIWDPIPEAVRVGVVYSIEHSDEKLREFADELTRNPNNQGYIIIGSRPDAKSSETNEREKRIIENIKTLFGNHPPPITLVPSGGQVDIVELWRIPPGAHNPTCKDCDTPPKCPTISVTGPAGIGVQGETIYFRAAIEPDSSSYTGLRWTVNDATIISGQDTLTLGVRMPKMPPVTVTILVEGLPKECANSASDRYDYAIDPGPILIDEFGRLSITAIRMRLNKFFAELKKNPNSQGYIILYGNNKWITARKRLIISQTNVRTFPRDRLTIVRGGLHQDGRIYTKLYRIPPGAENPVR